MKLIRLFGLFIFLTFGLTAPAVKMYAQQGTSGPTGLALEITYYPGRDPGYQPVPGPDAKPSGAWFGLFRRIDSWQAPAGAQPIEAVRVISRVEGDAVRVTVSTLSGS